MRGVSNKHCLLTFFILSIFEWPLKTGFTVVSESGQVAWDSVNMEQTGKHAG